MSAGGPLIDVHTHVVPERFPAYAGRHADARWPSMAPAQPCHQHMVVAGSVYRTLSHQCWDCRVRAQDMERSGVTRQVLSPMPELLSYWMAPEDGAAFCRFLNETIATLAATDPRRFTGLGAVPLQDVDCAIHELDHAVHQLDLAGVEIATNVNGAVIGDAKFEPFFAAAEQWGAAIFVHPLRPAGLDRVVGPALMEQVLAFPGETGLAAASMITGGTLAKHPKLRIAYSHGGGTFHALLPRLQQGWQAFARLRESITLEPVVAARGMFYDSLVYDGPTLERLIAVFGDTQVMTGSDYPFPIMETDPAGRVAALQVTDDAKRRLRAGNAQRWLAEAS
jgi:aminocarboxymuconate-semialdehyde decarboxylase